MVNGYHVAVFLFFPSLFGGEVRHFHCVAEKIEIEGAAHPFSNCARSLAYAVWCEQCAR